MGSQRQRTYRIFEFVNRRIGWVATTIVLIAIGLSVAGPSFQTDEEAAFSPTGEIYDLYDRADAIFEPETSLGGAIYIVEDPDLRDALSQPVLAEFKARSDAARAATQDVKGLPLNSRYATGVDLDLGLEIDGIFSIADAVDAHLPNGLANASNADVKMALAEMLADGSPDSALRFTLSRQTTTSIESVGGSDITVWKTPAFFAQVRYDSGSFSGEDELIDAEAWLIAIQTELRDGHTSTAADPDLNVWGVGIDFETAFQKSFQDGGPYVFLAVALIVLLVGALLRSFWAATVAAMGLGVTMLAYNGLIAIVQLEVSPLLQLIAPIAMISFGVDFFIHGAGRVREAQVEGAPSSRAYPIGASAVFLALILAAATSAAAFLSNLVSGVEAIREFGVGCAIALVLAYLILGVISPRVLIGIEQRLGPHPTGRSTFRMAPYKVMFVFAAIVAGVMVSMTVVLPAIGGPLFAIYLLLFAYLPYLWTKRRNARAAAKGRPVGGEIKGAGHGLKAAGNLVHFLARWRVVTIPIVVIIAVIGTVLAFQVKKEFELRDFLPSTSNVIASLDKYNHYFTSEGDFGGPGFILVEGDLTQPQTIAAMEAAIETLTGSDAPFSRDVEDEVEISPNAVSILRITMSSPDALAAIQQASGIAVSDADGDGLPDTAAQAEAAYEFVWANGVPGTVFSRPDLVQRYLHVEEGSQATRLEVTISSFTDAAIISSATQELNATADQLRSSVAGGVATIGVTGDPITNADSLDSFIQSMLLSLPIALALAIAIAALAMRSIRYALASMIPILLVVAWIYGYMVLADLKINPVTATIAAIAIGVGIDFATHFTVRFREEFIGEPSRFPALRRAGEGTGGALALSAITSIIGFWALSLAPTPIFSAFGRLTAVMVFFSVAVSLLVLPSILLLVTPGRKGSLRERLIEEVTEGGAFEYDPHARQTALRGPDTA